NFAGETFRWVANDASLIATSESGESGTLDLDLVSGPGMAGQRFDMQIRVGGSSLTLKASGKRERLRAHLTLKPGSNRIDLHVDGSGRAIPGDPRTLNFRVFDINWTPDRK